MFFIGSGFLCKTAADESDWGTSVAPLAGAVGTGGGIAGGMLYGGRLGNRSMDKKIKQVSAKIDNLEEEVGKLTNTENLLAKHLNEEGAKDMLGAVTARKNKFLQEIGSLGVDLAGLNELKPSTVKRFKIGGGVLGGLAGLGAGVGAAYGLKKHMDKD